MAGGSKPKYTDPELLEAKIQEFFDQHKAPKSVPTVAGLCVHCGFASKQTFYNYAKRKGFKEVIDRATMRLEDHAWKRGRTIDIFYLKNHHGMRDNQTVDLNANVKSRNTNLNAQMTPEQAAQAYEQLINDTKPESNTKSKSAKR